MSAKSLSYTLSLTRGRYDAFERDTMVINVTATLDGERTRAVLSARTEDHYDSDGEFRLIEVYRIWDERSAGWNLIDVRVIPSAEQPTIDRVIRRFLGDPAVRNALIWEPVSAEQRSTEPSVPR